ncbi:MAG: DNA translocase FtsK [Bacteriovoracaceae bacterium]|nr:DNA translocase FtsK [Bacteriovoracaceae bacterium]
MERPIYIKKNTENHRKLNYQWAYLAIMLFILLVWLLPGMDEVDTFHSVHLHSTYSTSVTMYLKLSLYYLKLIPSGFIFFGILAASVLMLFSVPTGKWRVRMYLIFFAATSFVFPQFYFGLWLVDAIPSIRFIFSASLLFLLAFSYLPLLFLMKFFATPFQVLRQVSLNLFGAEDQVSPSTLNSSSSPSSSRASGNKTTHVNNINPRIEKKSPSNVSEVTSTELAINPSASENVEGEGEGEVEGEVEEEVNIDKTIAHKRPLVKDFTEIQDYESMLDCLQANKKPYDGPTQKYFYEISQKIQDKLAEFKITATIVNILKGPVVDTFELELGPGIKVSKINSIQEDLGLALSGAPLRVVYPLKGRSTVGLEVPRNPRELIYLEDILKSDHFRNNKWRLPIAMGLDTMGSVTVIDLASMPHMLVAGSTGSGKSVFINTLLVSLLMKCSSDYMRLLLIDPKQLELAPYSKVPHLLMPVVIEASMAAVSLLWCCQEMERRYSLMREMGVRNLEGYNNKVKEELNDDQIKRIYPHLNDSEKESRFYALPFIVVIIDEFADLILSKHGKDIENNVCRLAAKARASGIHMVLATQRPSVDVITGLIKSNFPTRVSFRVVSGIDSRTILSTNGAEKLLGMGDMLYRYGVETERMHAAYVNEDEIEKLVELIAVDELEFNPDLIELTEKMQESMEDGEGGSTNFMLAGTGVDRKSADDELYDQAVKVVVEMRAASASMLQRRLRVGYNRAANLIEEMEKNGVVGPQEGSRPRKVLV